MTTSVSSEPITNRNGPVPTSDPGAPSPPGCGIEHDQIGRLLLENLERELSVRSKCAACRMDQGVSRSNSEI